MSKVISDLKARRWVVRGRVQGVGFRYFVEGHARNLGLKGWVRNQDDGSVLAYAIGTDDELNQLAGLLRQGPRMAEVRGVEEETVPVQPAQAFHVQ